MLSMMAENSTDTESVKNKTTVEMLRDGGYMMLIDL